MARLFVTPRELNFFSDITKELIKDIVGQFVYLYPISEIKTLAHEVYNEAIQKIYDNPIKLDALVDSRFQEDTKITASGIDQQYKLDVFVQYRDLIEKGVKISIGDFISYSDIHYEIVDVTTMRNIYGQAEHKDGIKMTCVRARETLFTASLLGPTDLKYTDANAVQTEFYQQRGQAENPEGVTGDVRDNQRNGNLDAPIQGIREVTPRGDDAHTDTSAFYDE
jgi:hypothetical protein